MVGNHRGDTLNLQVIFQYSPLSVNELYNDHSVLLFPNPACEEFEVKGNIAPGTWLMVFNELGENIFARLFSVSAANYKLDTVNWSNGIYLIRILNKVGSIVKKIAIEHSEKKKIVGAINLILSFCIYRLNRK